MSCAIGYSSNGKVYIGVDSICVSEENLFMLRRKDTKIFTFNKALVAFVGSWRNGQILKYELNDIHFKYKVDDEMKYLVKSYVPDVINTMNKYSCSIDSKDGMLFNSEILIGWNGKLFIIGSDFQVIEISENFASIGCGDTFATGFLTALEYYSDKKLLPEEKIRITLENVEKNYGSVTSPFIIKSI